MTAGFDLSHHNVRLQSLRGVAALAVAVGHAAICVDNSASHLPMMIARIFFQANTAVVFFFVLSGLVLGSSLQRSANDPAAARILSFAVRRLLRLMPIVILSLLLAGAMFKCVEGQSVPAMASWFDGYFHIPVTWSGILENAVFVENNINGVLWSIRVEVLMIPLLPLFTRLITVTPLIVDVGIVAALWFLGWLLLPNGNGTSVHLFFYCFYAGMCLYKVKNQKLVTLLRRGDLMVMGLLLIGVAEAFWILNQLWIGYKYAIDAAVSAQLLLFVMLRPDFSGLRFLNSWFLKTLGDVSFSFYAFGMAVTVPAFLVLNFVFPFPVPLSWISSTLVLIAGALLAITTIFGISVLTFRFVEVPSINIGRKVSRLFSRSVTV